MACNTAGMQSCVKQLLERGSVLLPAFFGGPSDVMRSGSFLGLLKQSPQGHLIFGVSSKPVLDL